MTRNRYAQTWLLGSLQDWVELHLIAHSNVKVNHTTLASSSLFISWQELPFFFVFDVISLPLHHQHHCHHRYNNDRLPGSQLSSLPTGLPRTLPPLPPNFPHPSKPSHPTQREHRGLGRHRHRPTAARVPSLAAQVSGFILSRNTADCFSSPEIASNTLTSPAMGRPSLCLTSR